jgi:hypothetical protein
MKTVKRMKSEKGFRALYFADFCLSPPHLHTRSLIVNDDLETKKRVNVRCGGEWKQKSLHMDAKNTTNDQDGAGSYFIFFHNSCHHYLLMKRDEHYGQLKVEFILNKLLKQYKVEPTARIKEKDLFR